MMSLSSILTITEEYRKSGGRTLNNARKSTITRPSTNAIGKQRRSWSKVFSAF